jgi:hypothetical protein
MQVARDYLEDCAMRAELTPHDFARQLITWSDHGNDSVQSEANTVFGEFFIRVSRALDYYGFTEEAVGQLSNSVIFMAAESWGAHAE